MVWEMPCWTARWQNSAPGEHLDQLLQEQNKRKVFKNIFGSANIPFNLGAGETVCMHRCNKELLLQCLGLGPTLLS
jgi:hypothetical protein